MKKLWLLTTAILVLGCASAQKAPPEAPLKNTEIHNFALDFIRYWEKVEKLPVEEQVRLLKADFFPKFPEFYADKIERWKKAGKNPDEEMAKQLSEFPAAKKDFVKKTKAIQASLKKGIEFFSKKFPDFNRGFRIYVTHSFGDMDGGTRQIDGKTYFIFGVDLMVKNHKGYTSEVPFFHHELFHMYHRQFLPEERVIWNSLWAEGLATYAAKKLNPNATMKDLILDLPEGMIPKIKKDLAFHWSDLASKLTSRDADDHKSYFRLSSENKKVVVRAGYYLGYLLAQEIGKTMSLSEMAQLDEAHLVPLLQKIIATKL
ncbi:hypothetical protein K2X30_10380 [bacterium]|jgi:hypothetical protein|nr:hypothetical protein [bacterium]